MLRMNTTLAAPAFVIAAAASLMIGTAVAPSEANAATTYATTANVNMRTGPSTSYPVVTVLPQNASLTANGCNASYTWCDVSYAQYRGWVSASYIYATTGGNTVIVSSSTAPTLGVAVINYNQTYRANIYSAPYGRSNTNVYVAADQPVSGSVKVSGTSTVNRTAQGATVRTGSATTPRGRTVRGGTVRGANAGGGAVTTRHGGAACGAAGNRGGCVAAGQGPRGHRGAVVVRGRRY